MNRLIWLIPAIIMVCVTAHAQEVPEWDVSGGFSYLDANLNRTRFNLTGGGGSLTENLNPWFGGRLEFNAYGGSESGTKVSAQTITYGPVFSYRHSNKWVPFANFQLGAIHASKGYLGISESAFKFDMTGGGGVNFNVNYRAAIRAEADYLMTRFLDLRQDNLRFSAGLVIYFGRK